MSQAAAACNTSDRALSCQCSDCMDACPLIPASDDIVPWWKLRLAPVLPLSLNVVLASTYILLIMFLILSLTKQNCPDVQIDFLERDPQQNTDISRRLEEISEKFESKNAIYRFLYGVGESCANNRRRTMQFWCLIVVCCLIALWYKPIEQISDPVQLWAGSQSRCTREKHHFDSTFGPFWRTEMMIVRSKDMNGLLQSSAIDVDILEELIDLQLQLESIEVRCDEVFAVSGTASCEEGDLWTIEDICFQPTPGAGCLVQSVTEYWQTNNSNLQASPACHDENGWGPSNKSSCNVALKQKVDRCAQFGSSQRDCWSRAGLPLIFPKVLFGAGGGGSQPSESEALIVTYLFNNDEWSKARALVWESKALDLIATHGDRAQGSRLDISYSMERALQDELDRQSSNDIPTVLLSYAVMFIYVALSIGRQRNPECRPRRVSERVLLASAGIFMVVVSLLVACTACSLLGIKATLVLSEVIPFLILAIGVDNIFILVWCFDESVYELQSDSQDLHLPPDPSQAEGAEKDQELVVKACAKTLAQVGPSIVSAASAESIAFLLGSSTGMPAVESFAYFACFAVLADVLIQLSLFPVILSYLEINLERSPGRQAAEQKGCIAIMYQHIQRILRLESHTAGLDENLLNQRDHENVEAADTQPETPTKLSWETFLLSSYYHKFVLWISILILFAAMICSCFIQLGLEQTDALPRDSFLVKYFTDVASLMQVGPPVFFVVNGLSNNLSSTESIDMTDTEFLRKLCTRQTCDMDSLGNFLSNAARYPETTYLASGVASIVDDLISWLLSSRADPSRACCRQALYSNGTRGPVCPAHWTPSLHPDEDFPSLCACNDSLTYHSDACPSAPAAPCKVAGGCLAHGLPDSAFHKYNATSGAGACWGVRLAGLCPEGGEAPFCQRLCYSKYQEAQVPCVPLNLTFPRSADVKDFFGYFMKSECPSDPGEAASCSTCGAHYIADLGNISILALQKHGKERTIDELGKFSVQQLSALRFMGYHSPLQSQEDYINALSYSQDLVDKVKKNLQLDIYAYSIFYAFFEQYLGIESSALSVSALAIAALALVLVLLLRNALCAFLIMVVAVTIEVVMVGVMGLCDIKLNALSTVNLVAAIGISVEFSVHLTHAFLSAKGPAEARAIRAVTGVGRAVFSGIAITKFLGVAVLGLAHSRIFVVYYFRMYMALVVCGSFFGLCLLPVLLVLHGSRILAGEDAGVPTQTTERHGIQTES
uniref:SSD domain-containing protein n=1 Tax=Hanusia phi TaxID=3032 RepID=A0A7S0EGY1_9CRYP